MAALDKIGDGRPQEVLTAQATVVGSDRVHAIRVRNLSAGGMMGEGDIAVDRGSQIKLIMPNIGTVAGTVAWTQDDRFGVAFADDIDADAVFGAGTAEWDDGDPRDGGVDRDRRSETRLL